MSAKLLPPNASPLERAFGDVLPSGLSPEPIRSLWDADTCPPPFLPFLGWAMSVDGWDSALTENQQRALIRDSVALHRRKGTVWAVKRVFEILNIEASLVEWPAYGGQPYTFRVHITILDRGINEASLRALGRLISEYKSERSHLDQLDIVLQTQAALYTAAATRVRPRCVAFPRLLPVGVQAPLRTVAVCRLAPRIRVTPRSPS